MMTKEISDYLSSDEYCKHIAEWVNAQCKLSNYFEAADTEFYYMDNECEIPTVRYTLYYGYTAFMIEIIVTFSNDIHDVNDVKKLKLTNCIRKVNIILDIIPSSISSNTTSMSKTEVNHLVKMIESFATTIEYFVFNDRETDCCSLKHIIECGVEAGVITEE